MSGLVFLQAEDFRIEQDAKGPLLCHRQGGLCLILFYSRQCESCKRFLPKFKTLPGSSPCFFGMVDIDRAQRRIVRLSEQTVSPITFVPDLILYVDGRPIVRYRGPREIEEILRFISEATQRMQHGQNFTKGKICRAPAKGDKDQIPSYCGFKMMTDEDVCYVTYNEAYQPPRK